MMTTSTATTHRRRPGGGLAATACVMAATTLVGFADTSHAADSPNIQVAGVQIPLDPSNGVFEMTGDLVGTWYTTAFELGVVTKSGVVTGTGSELFVGCYDADHDAACTGSDPTGSITFSFEYSGRFDPETGALLHGRCHHPVTGGSGDFAAARGALGFHDDPSGCSFYKGHLSW
jgi:hypothetical protein